MPSRGYRLFTSESVTEGHPDKVCDQIADAVLDAYLEQDPDSRVACDAVAHSRGILVAGQITSSAEVDVPQVVQKTLQEIGYEEDSPVGLSVDRQSADIARGVDGEEMGAGDQGIMFGYAARETQELMPLPIQLSHRLAQRLAEVRKDGTLPLLRPDGKTQVTVRYDDDGRPVGLDTILISTQHAPEIDQEQLARELLEEVVRPVVPGHLLRFQDGELVEPRLLVNPTGRFVVGGPAADTGLTGRKVIVDTYGGAARHGGGAFSGKDPSKVDRSATYAARWVAKNLVGAGLADRAEVALSYAIGLAHPVSVAVNAFGTENVPQPKLEQAVEEVFDLRPGAIIEQLDLKRPIYRETAAYGHFGRSDLDLPWERLDRVEQLQEAVGNQL